MRPAIKRGRQAGRLSGGRQMWLRADLTHRASVLPPSQGRLSEKADGRATEETWCTLELRDACLCSYKCISKDSEKHLAFAALSAPSVCSHLCVFTVFVCVSVHAWTCASLCSPAQFSDSLHGDTGPQVWHLRAQTEGQGVWDALWGKRQTLKTADQSRWCFLSEHQLKRKLIKQLLLPSLFPFFQQFHSLSCCKINLMHVFQLEYSITLQNAWKYLVRQFAKYSIKKMFCLLFSFFSLQTTEPQNKP